ncbi:hypothetical protein [Bosea sp. RAC05]|uniref:hypothetical protein n=1 Tax=Bosea sp. RAC05 TaxID=1842539 RepID=UPI00085757CF|nr:hypothetical protein [Bosea sp. RAC05]AOG03454.1 hypothetical protein BSY19_5331 [Bosea sp. RAC05]
MDPIIHVPVPYAVSVRFGRSRDLSTVYLRRDLPVRLQGIESARAPIAVSLRARLRPPIDLDWREVAGRLFRPLLDNAGCPVAVTGFQQAVQQALANPNDSWSDFPIVTGGRGIQSTASNLEGFDTAKLISDAWLEASVAAAKIFDQDILVIDGIIHKASPPPVWSPAAGSASMAYGLHRVSLIIPGFEHSSCIRFRGDQAKEACELASLLARRAEQFPPGTQQPKVKELEVDPGTVAIVDAQFVPDPRADSFKSASDDIRDAMKPAVLGDTPFELLAAYVDLQRAAASLPAISPDDSEIAACAQAFNAYLAAYRAYGDTDWPRGAQSQEFAMGALTVAEIIGPPESVVDHDLTGLGL